MRKSQANPSSSKGAKSAAGQKPAPQSPTSQTLWQWWTTSPLALGMTSAVALFLAFPPAGLWPLAWLAPLGWLWLIRLPELRTPSEDDPSSEQKKSERPSRMRRFITFWRRPYPAIWLSGFVFWMCTLHWLRLPHWGTSVGWVALCFYFAFYLPLFVGLSRVLVHRLHVSIILAAPVVWTAMEFIRAYMLTGFSMAELGHSQHGWNTFIQVADLGGSFLVSFVVMLIVACFARMLPMPASKSNNKVPLRLWPLLPAAAVLGTVLAYGAWRTGQPHVDDSRSIRVALIQSSFDTEFRFIEGREKLIMDTYWKLSLQAVQESGKPIDLLVWPESMFRMAQVTNDDDVAVPSGWDQSLADFRQDLAKAQKTFRDQVNAVYESINTPAFLAGLGREHFTKDGVERYNSAIFVKPLSNGTDFSIETYDKMHAVPFGEYVPLSRFFPWIYDILPLSGGIEEGTRPHLLEVSGMTFSPSICFESIQSHHIRDSAVELQETEGHDPDLLINVTNDGWFWGSSELDLHLICGKFRAVENRKPFLIAANTGISAAIDGNGQVLERGPKRGNAIIVRDVSPDPRGSLYLDYGPWPAWICLGVCLIAGGLGIRDRISGRKSG